MLVALLAAGPATAEDSDAEPAAETRHYDWMTNGVKSGSLVVHLTEGGRTRSSRFEFNDRGRGPGLTEVVSLATDGRITSLETSGHSYMGAPVDERMWLDAEGIHWSSTLEQGSSGRQDAWYLVNDGTPGMDAMLARALLGSPGGTLDLLPNGTASISKLTEFKPATPDNAPLLSLYAISGVDLGPRLIWLDGQGELFGLSDGSAGMVPTGWSHVLPDIKARQDKAEQAFHESRSRPLTHRLPAIYAITNVNVIDVANGTLLKDRVVKVADGRIIAVTTAEKTPDDVNTIDAGGGYLAPGLWDMHTHLSLGQGLLHLAGGVAAPGRRRDQCP
jgi:hypothetical protein